MQRDATKASVALPPKDSDGQTYSFSFAAQRESLAYAPGSLEPLSVQLAEVKAICAVLFQAKVNSLDNIRRERVSEDDLKGPQTDYLPEKSVTNELAVLSPYEVTFRCFSSELAAVLAGFAGFALRPAGQDHQRRVGAGCGRRHRSRLRTGRSRHALCPACVFPGGSRRAPRRREWPSATVCGAEGAGRGGIASATVPRSAQACSSAGVCPAGGARAGQPGRPADSSGREAVESHLDAQCGETGRSQVRWIFSRNITKRSCSAWCCWAWRWRWPFCPSRSPVKSRSWKTCATTLIHPKVKPLTNLDLTLPDTVLKRVAAPAMIDFSAPNKLFNPMPWQKAADGHLIKVDATNIGPNAVTITKMAPLYLKLTLDSVTLLDTGPRYVIGIEKEAALNPRDRTRRRSTARSTRRTTPLPCATSRPRRTTRPMSRVVLELNDTGAAGDGVQRPAFPAH